MSGNQKPPAARSVGCERACAQRRRLGWMRSLGAGAFVLGAGEGACSEEVSKIFIYLFTYFQIQRQRRRLLRSREGARVEPVVGECASQRVSLGSRPAARAAGIRVLDPRPGAGACTHTHRTVADALGGWVGVGVGPRPEARSRRSRRRAGDWVCVKARGARPRVCVGALH